MFINKLIPIASMVLTLALNCQAQYAKLLDFTGPIVGGNGDDARGTFVTDGTFLYGMTRRAGTSNDGLIFKILPDGTGYVKLMDFTATATGSDPLGSLFYDGTFLYGMTSAGGANGVGTIFKIATNGTGFDNLFDFNQTTDGGRPEGSLISDGTFLYGMTSVGGANGDGTVFKILSNGTGFQKIFDFTNATSGASPGGSLLFDGVSLFGLTSQGGTSDFGTIFKILPDGTGFTKLLDFAGAANGREPFNGDLISDGTFLYGMTFRGGTNDSGIIFRIMPNGTGFMKLLDFVGTTNGADPQSGLTYHGNFVYGMTRFGGTSDLGTMFKILPDGTGYEKLIDFSGSANGSQPFGSLLVDNGILFGMTQAGGASNQGVIFKYNIQPTITSFMPTSGSIGNTVTITGTNFSTTAIDNVVRFNGQNAYVVSSTNTSITAIVPPDASTGVIAVTVSGNTANSATNFNVVPFSCPPIAPTSGDLDIAFDPVVQSAVSFSAVGLQSTGKIIVAAPAVTIAGSNYEGILRFNEDGTLDAGFTTSLLYPSAQQLLVLPDDKIIGVVNGEPNAYISRLNDDGTPDGSFTGPNFDNSSTYDVIIGPLALQSDGKLLYSSTNTFDYVDDLVRLNTNGTPDLSFDTPAGFDIDANVIKQQADGKIVLAGALGVARLDEFGAIDPSFLAISMLDGVINDLVIQPDGKIILIGTFTSIHGVPNRNIARLNSDGSVDTSFGTGNGFSLYSGAQPTVIKQTSNGSLIIAGEFISYNDVGRNRLLLLNSDGSLQCSFNPQTGPDAQLLDVAVQADGKILIVGSLTDYNGTAKNAFARVNNSISCVPASERAALIALYNSTDGDDWTNDANWLSTDENTWFGVVVTGCRVTNLVLNNNNLAGPLPTEIGDLPQLQTLQLGSNLLTNSIPNSIGNLTSLITIDFRGNQLSGAIPSTIGNISTLQSLTLDQNQLTGAIPNSIYNLVNLKELELGANQLSGSIPPTISNLANLQALGLSGNQFSGSLPTELGSLTNLTRLQLGVNQFTGTLPSNIGNLINLSSFSVFNNQLTGTVPASLANLVNLTGLGLSVNQFTGDVPAGIGLIPNLNDVSLRDNDFTSIPTFVSNSFTDLLVYGNKLNFGHLEPNIGKGGFVYAPQDNLPGGVASACTGTTLTINFSTPGTANQYQWYKDGVLLPGATSTTFTKSNAVAGDAGNYTVQVTNTIVTGLTLQTDNFVVTITAPPLSPTAANVSVCPDTAATLTSSGGTNGQYRWYTSASGGTAIAGQTNSTFITPGVSVVTTFYVSLNNGSCESSRTAVVVTPISSACAPPSITPSTILITIGGNESLDLKTWITTPSGTLDVNSISVTVPPPSGAIATVVNGVLTLDYKGIAFAGRETVTVRACDTFGNCSTEQIEIDVTGDLNIYTGISPNGDIFNEVWLIQNIEILDETKSNKVSIYNRWGDVVWEVENYENKDRVFKGLNKNGNELPSGTYFYKIEFGSGRKSETGYLSLKR